MENQEERSSQMQSNGAMEGQDEVVLEVREDTVMKNNEEDQSVVEI